MKKIKLGLSILLFGLIALYVSNSSYGNLCKDKPEFRLYFASDGKLESVIPANLSQYEEVNVSMCYDDDPRVREAFDGYKAAYDFFSKPDPFGKDCFTPNQILDVKNNIANQLWSLQNKYPSIISPKDLKGVQQTKTQSEFELPDITQLVSPIFTYQVDNRCATAMDSVRLNPGVCCGENTLYSKKIKTGELGDKFEFSLIIPEYEMHLNKRLSELSNSLANSKDSVSTIQHWLIVYALIKKGDTSFVPLKTPNNETDSMTLKSLNKQLALLDQEIEMLKLMMGSFDGSEGDNEIVNTKNHLSLYTELITKRSILLESIADISKKLSASKPSGGKKSITINTLAYHGYLFTGTNDFSRYHDAKHDFILGDSSQGEITELQLMHIMVNNKDASSKYKLLYQVKDVPSDNPGLAVKLDLEKLNTFTIESDSSATQVSTLTPGLSVLIEAFQMYSQRLDTYLDDYIPSFETVEVGHQVPANRAPFTVPYSISMKNKTGGDSIISNVNMGYGYRINKLYRFRFKPGLAFSWFEKKNYVVDGNNVATLTSDRHGTDVIVGMQGYFWKNDIRSPKVRPRPFLYLGFSVKSNPANNIFLGGGFEPLNGVALMGGMHISQTSRLLNTNGILSVEQKRWGVGAYVSVSADFIIFNRFFNFSNITVPTAKQ